MTKLTSEQYLEASARTVSDQFHSESLPSGTLAWVLGEAVVTGAILDQVKRTLFYGKEYEDHATARAAGVFNELLPFADRINPDILHGAIGLFTEAAELIEAIYKGAKTGEFDGVNIKEELGDCEWYLALLYRSLGANPGEVKFTNIEKLKKRFPEKFSTQAALNRDLDGEREVLKTGGVLPKLEEPVVFGSYVSENFIPIRQNERLAELFKEIGSEDYSADYKIQNSPEVADAEY